MAVAIEIAQFVAMMILIGCGVAFLRWWPGVLRACLRGARDTGRKTPGNGSPNEDKRKSGDSQARERTGSALDLREIYLQAMAT